MKQVRSSVHVRALTLGLLVLTMVGAAFGGTINTFHGVDPNSNGGTVLTNSSAAATQFGAGVLGLNQIQRTNGFESVPTGSFTNLDLGGGVSLALTNAPNSSIDDQSNSVVYNTTPGGKNFFVDFTNYIAAGDSLTAQATFTFANPIDAFGAYLEGVGTPAGTGGQVTFDFSDGSNQSLPATGFGDGSTDAQFFGFTDPGAQISSVTMTVNYTAPSPSPYTWAYYFGVDDVTYATVPEPSSLMLLGASLAGFAGVIRRKLNR